MVIGIMFSLLWLGEILASLLSKKIPESLSETGLWVNPVHILDLGFLLPAMIIVSVLLWRKKLLGFFLSVPLLVFAITMGTGIIILFIIVRVKGEPIPMALGIIMGVIVLVSVYFVYGFLKEIKVN